MKSLLLLLLTLAPLSAADRPNILWLTSEDNAAHWLGCYGNEQAHTPNLDALAKRSVRFTNFYSNAPVCAVARSTILNGVYAPSQGTQHMRSRHPIPTRIKPYVFYLRQQGYYTTNASKTDYNFKGQDASLWDESSPKAHYKNRSKNQPFFAIFNLTVSHESSLFPARIQQNRTKGLIPKTTRINPNNINVPPCLPDLPEIRSDLAIYHDTITALDKQIGEKLTELEQAGLASNTIIFYYSDHGGAAARGKRYLKDTGVNVPLLIHVPEKWQHLSPYKPVAVTTDPTAFVDLAPTLLSLLGLEKPAHMQGRAFLGTHAQPLPDDHHLFLFADRFDELFGMRRGLTDGRWKYIRRFNPRLPAAPYSFYQFGQDGWTAWQKAWQDGQLSGRFASIWENNQPIEELYDTESDPWETTNLATNPAHNETIKDLRNRLHQKMVAVTDTGLIPEPLFQPLAGDNGTIADYARTHRQHWDQLLHFAKQATSRDKQFLPKLTSALSHEEPVVRYWAALGCLTLGPDAAPAKDALLATLNDEHSVLRITAAVTLTILNAPEGPQALVNELPKAQSESDYLYLMNAFTHTGTQDQIPSSLVTQSLKQKNLGEYPTRFLTRIAQSRNLPLPPAK